MTTKKVLVASPGQVRVTSSIIRIMPEHPYAENGMGEFIEVNGKKQNS